MTRTTFAGAIVGPADRRVPRRRCGTRQPGGVRRRSTSQGVTPECLNAGDLREWIRNAPANETDVLSDADKLGPDGKYRGMPDLGLTEDQIDQLVAYLLERK